VYQLPLAGSSTFVFVSFFLIAAEHGPQVALEVASTLAPGGTFADLVGFTCSVVPVASVEMSVTVDYLKLLDINHLM
jgi:hypothetical protein